MIQLQMVQHLAILTLVINWDVENAVQYDDLPVKLYRMKEVRDPGVIEPLMVNVAP